MDTSAFDPGSETVMSAFTSDCLNYKQAGHVIVTY